jgi:hypothetical protein
MCWTLCLGGKKKENSYHGSLWCFLKVMHLLSHAAASILLVVSCGSLRGVSWKRLSVLSASRQERTKEMKQITSYFPYLTIPTKKKVPFKKRKKNVVCHFDTASATTPFPFLLSLALPRLDRRCMLTSHRLQFQCHGNRFVLAKVSFAPPLKKKKPSTSSSHAPTITYTCPFEA